MAEKIELMADYGCYPLWWAVGSGKAGDIDPETLPLKPETIKWLQKWAAIFDNLLNHEDPAASGFASAQDRNAFSRQGISLWHQLRKELSPDYEVGYFSQRLRQHLTHPSELEVYGESIVAR